MPLTDRDFACREAREILTDRGNGDGMTAQRTGSGGRRLAAVVATSAALVGVGAGVAHADVNPALGYDAQSDKGSLQNMAGVVGALDAYRMGLTGQGGGVALPDTRRPPGPGPETGKVINRP